MEHTSVMLQQCIDALNIKADGIYVDGTLGRAGHASKILEKLTTGKLYGFDLDQQALEESRAKLESISSNFELIYSNFADMKQQLQLRNVDKVDGILLDLGVSLFKVSISFLSALSFSFAAFNSSSERISSS